MKYLYAAECEIVFDEIMLPNKQDISEAYKKFKDAFMSTPLENMRPNETVYLLELLKDISHCIKDAVQ